MIKKAAASALTILYITTVVGFVLNLNYCCNRLTSVSINTPVNSCGMPLNGTKCCKTRYVNVKVNDVHQNGFLVLSNRISGFQILKPMYFNFEGGLYYKIAEVKSDKRPPPIPFNKIEACTKNCIFRI